MARDPNSVVMGSPVEPGGTPSKCRMWCTTFTAVMIMCAITTVLCHYVHLPTGPKYTGPEFTVYSATVYSSNLSSSTPDHLFSNFDLTLSVQNGGKTSYEVVSATVFYGSDTISETSLYDGKQNETTMFVKMTTAKPVEGDAANGGITDSAAVTFNVTVVATIQCWNVGYRWTPVVEVNCTNVTIGFKNLTAAVGSLLGHPMPCASN